MHRRRSSARARGRLDRSAFLRQKEITEEIELILLNRAVTE